MRKVLAATTTCLMVLFGIVSSFAQSGKFDVRIKLKNSDCVAKKITIQVQVKAHDAASTFKMGDANFRFDFDPLVVKNPKNISQENFSNVAPSNDLNYTAHTLTGTQVTPDGTKGIVSLNVLYSGSNAGAKLVSSTDYMTVACIQFDIVSTTGCVNFRWHTDNATIDFPITGMNEIVETSADPYDYNNPVVAAGGVFESLNQCIAPLCSAPAVDAIRDVFTTNINTAFTGNALSNDSPTTGLTVKTATLGTPLHGSISMSSTGIFTYTPSTGYVGKDSVLYEACNASNVCDNAYIVINVTGPAPTAVRDPYSLAANTSVSGNILTNDTPTGGLTVKISPFPTPLHGSLTLSTNGAFTYTPQAGYVGKDSIQYQACNGNNVCATAYAVFTVTGPTPLAVRDTYSTTDGVPVSGNVITNDIGVTTVKISPLPMPLHGGITLSTSGAFTYTPTAGYVGKDSILYQSCNGANQCSQAYAVFTITGIPNPNVQVDLSLTKTVNQKKAAIGDIITYTITVKNEGQNPATGVSIKDFMPAGVLYQTYATAFGNYNNTTGIWTIGNVAVNQTVTLLISVKALTQGTFFNRAEIWTCNEQDIDSEPANSPVIQNQSMAKSSRIAALPTNPLLEDDNGTACFYIPVEICDGSSDEYVISVPAGYSQIQWYKDDVAIAGATAATYTVSTPGKYTFTTFEGTCPAGGCCPAEFVIISCCKPNICVPYSVVKTKSGKK
jgi:uncharacterized repeat protein (TIGR01451 family)